MPKDIAFVGGGVMAEAMIEGLLGKGLVASDRMTVSSPRQDRRAELASRHGVRVCGENREAATAGASEATPGATLKISRALNASVGL